MVFSHPPNPGKDMPVLCLFSDKLRYLHLFTTIILGQCWPCQAEICGCPGTTPVKHLNCMPPTHSCLSKLTFRLVWRHAYLHIEIPWMSGATPPPPIHHHPSAHHWFRPDYSGCGLFPGPSLEGEGSWPALFPQSGKCSLVLLPCTCFEQCVSDVAVHLRGQCVKHNCASKRSVCQT